MATNMTKNNSNNNNNNSSTHTCIHIFTYYS